MRPLDRWLLAVLASGCFSAAAQTAGAGPVGAVAPDLTARVWASSCAACHGSGGTAAGAIPALAMRDADALGQVLLTYRRGQRQGPGATLMQQLTLGYTEAELQRIARALAADAAAETGRAR